MERIIFDISSYDLQDWDDGKVTNEEFLSRVFTHNTSDGDDNKSVIISHLEYYHIIDTGAPEIHDFEVISVQYDKTTKTGAFTLEYVVYHEWGCENFNKEYERSQRWGFEIYRSAGKLNLFPEQRPVRDTVEEY